MTRRLCTLCVLVALLGVGGACEHDKTAMPTVPDCLPGNSPEQVLDSLVTSMRNRDFDTYRKQLDANYQFRYRPPEVGHWDMPFAHGLADELCAAKVLLADPDVDTIGVRLVYTPATAVTDSAAPSTAIRQIDVSVAYLYVVGPRPGGLIYHYECSEVPQRFFFSSDNKTGCAPRYLIVGHYELNYAPRPTMELRGPSVIPESWGWLKHNMLVVSREEGGPCSE